MKRLLILIPCALAITPAQAECVASDVTSAVKPYANCAVARGSQLEASGESPDNIAIAAASFCLPFKRNALSSLSTCIIPEIKDEIERDIDRRIRNLVITRVVEKRATP